MPDDIDSYPGIRIQPPDTVGNPALAAGFLNRHYGNMENREREVADVQAKQQANLEELTKLLDETTNSLKASRQGRVNLPLMALGAGLLSSRGNFGEQLGAGLRMAIPAISADRAEEDDYQNRLAQIAMRRGAIQNAPLDSRLAYLKALQTGDQTAARAIEQALIRTNASEASKDRNQVQKAVGDALQEARRQFDTTYKEQYVDDPQAAQQKIDELFMQQIAIRRASGLDIPDAVVQSIMRPAMPAGVTQTGGNPFKAKTGFAPPTDEQTAQAGLPPKPAGYVYDMIGPKDVAGHLKEETKKFNKLSEDWGADFTRMQDLNARMGRIDELLQKYPEVVGRKKAFPNAWVMNISPQSKELEMLFKNIEVNNFPKGQGQVSNAERELFARANPNMEAPAEVNRRNIAMAKQLMQREQDRRQFLQKYFESYRTIDGASEAWQRYIDSPAGQAFIADKDGQLIANPDRVPWQKFFQSERMPKKAAGGMIHLGEDYDG